LAAHALRMGKKIRTRKIVRDPRFTTTNIKGRRAVSVASLRTQAERQEKKDTYGEALQRKKERKQARVEAWQGVKKPSAPPTAAATDADGTAVHPMSAEAQLAAAKKKKKKGPNRGGKERRARHRDKITNKKEEWAPTPRGDLAHWLRAARKGGVPVKSKNEMPAVQELGTMMKRFRKRLQPRSSDYNGQGIARPSAYIQLRTAEFLGQFKEVFDEHVGEWGGRHLKTFRSEKDMQMEWRQRLKQKQATDESVFRSKRDIKEMRREQRQIEQKQQELAAIARGGSGDAARSSKRKRAPEAYTQPLRAGGVRPQHAKKQKAARDPGAEAERAQALAAYKQLKQKQALHTKKQRPGGPR
jgi:hypothetical protein